MQYDDTTEAAEEQLKIRRRQYPLAAWEWESTRAEIAAITVTYDCPKEER